MENKKISSNTRQLIRSSGKAFLATEACNKLKVKLKVKNTQRIIPYNTFVMVAFDYDCSPLLLLSDLSDHTKNINENNTVSILFYEDFRNIINFPIFNSKKLNKEIDYEDPMSRPRVTIVGKLNMTKSKSHKERFISRHPASKLYSDFKDMNIYKLNIISGDLTGGFAQVKMFNKNDLIYKKCKGFKENEMDILNHMNIEHQESVNMYARKLLCQTRKKDNWKMVGIDPEGFDLRNSDKLIRYSFSQPLIDADQLRKEFILLHKKVMSID